MKEKGFLFLPQNFDVYASQDAYEQLSVTFVRWCDISRTVKSQISHTSLSGVRDHLDQQPVDHLIAVLPTSSVSMMEVETPTTKSRQLKQALPFLVEEQSAQELDNILLVTDFKPVNNRLTVTAVDKALIEKTLSLFEYSQLTVSEIYSTEQLLPSLEQQLFVMIDGETAYLSLAGNKPLCLPIKQFAWLLPKYVSKTSSELLNIKLVLADSSTMSYADFQQEIDRILPEELSVEIYPDNISDSYSYLASLAGAGTNQSSYYQNLLFGKYAPKKQTNQWLTLLAPTAVFASVVLCCHLALSLYNGYTYQQKANQLQTEVYATMQKAIPGIRLNKLKSDRALRGRIKEALSRSGNTTEAILLDKVASDLIQSLKSFGNEKQPYVQRLSYRAAVGETQLELHANSFAQVDQMKESLTKAGYDVTVGSVTNDSGTYKGRLILKAGEGS